jgi:hypothetical protein
MPDKIMLIRHGEKPTDENNKPYGVKADGEQDFESLLPRGWQRAGALAVLFDPARGALQAGDLAVPDKIYASHDKQRDKGSKRPKQTVEPLADRLGLKIDLSFERKETAKLAGGVLKQKGVVLISWQHELIIEIVTALTAGRKVSGTIPPCWPDDRFDLVWVLSSQGDGWLFTQIPQRLLAGDADTVAVAGDCPQN